MTIYSCICSVLFFKLVMFPLLVFASIQNTERDNFLKIISAPYLNSNHFFLGNIVHAFYPGSQCSSGIKKLVVYIYFIRHHIFPFVIKYFLNCVFAHIFFSVYVSCHHLHVCFRYARFRMSVVVYLVTPKNRSLLVVDRLMR